MPKSKTITKYWHGELIEYDANLTDEQFLLKYYPYLMRIRLKRLKALQKENQSRIDEGKAAKPQN